MKKGITSTLETSLNTLEEYHKKECQEIVIVSDDDNCIKIWSWENAPDYLKNLSEHGGDEDWIAVLPPSYLEQYIPFLEDGSSFGYCEVSCHEHPNLKGYQVRIGAHA